VLKRLMAKEECWEWVTFNSPQECSDGLKIPVFGSLDTALA